MVMPGDNVKMEIDLIQPIAMEQPQRFAIREGGRTIGSGVVTEIIPVVPPNVPRPVPGERSFFVCIRYERGPPPPPPPLLAQPLGVAQLRQWPASLLPLAIEISQWRQPTKTRSASA